MTRSQHAVRVLDTMFKPAHFPIDDFVKRMGICGTPSFLQSLREAGILHVVRAGVTSLLAFRELLSCAEGKVVLIGVCYATPSSICYW